MRAYSQILLRSFLILGLGSLLSTNSCVHMDQADTNENPFQKRDTNGNGHLSHEEIAEYSHRQMLEEYDLNNDSHISPAEWRSAHPSAAQADEHFNLVDKNSDGKVEVDEAVLWVTEHVSYSNKFKELDANEDGMLHFKEMADAEESFWNVTVFSLKFT